MKNPLRSIKLWQKFSAIGVIATVLCAVPLVQVIQYKNSEIATAQAENAGLGQVRTAAVLQRHLHAHRGLSSMVLHGNAGAGISRRRPRLGQSTRSRGCAHCRAGSRRFRHGTSRAR